jgi:aspartate kinase
MRIVMKFGGTSVADAQRITHVAGLIQAAATQHAVVPVVSAMDQVTEMLLDLAEAAAAGNALQTEALLRNVHDKHLAAAYALGAQGEVTGLLDRLDALARGVLALEELTPRARDAIVAYGERLSCAMLAHALGGRALDGREAGIVTDDHFGEADPLMDLSMYQVAQSLGPALERGDRFVVTGFVAANQHGVTSTLGRGGSDYTATILGAALKADEIWIYSDVDGLMTADPRSVADARLLAGLSFAEAVEMGKFGAKSMHPRALEPAAAHSVPVRMRSTFKPEHPGTLISDAAASGPGGAGGTEPARPSIVRCVPMLKNLAMVNIGGAAMIGRPGSASEVFAALAQQRVNVHMICQSVSEAGISLVVGGGQLDRARVALEKTLKLIGSPRTIEVVPNVCVVAAVGAGMRGTKGVAARIFAAIAQAGVNVVAIAQGSSEMSISIVVEASAGPAAVRAIHDEFELGRA